MALDASRYICIITEEVCVRRGDRPWLLLIHRMPSTPAYLRVKVSRRLQRVGAVLLKSTVYVLPASEQSREGFEWIAQEIIDSGGEAAIAEVRFVAGIGDGHVERIFQEARRADAAAIVAAASVLEPAVRMPGGGGAERHAAIKTLKRRLAAMREIDFFGSPDLAAAARLLESLEEGAAAKGAPPERRMWNSAGYRGRTWVTRAGVHVDRIASAWLIGRFIDAGAAFKFVTSRSYAPAGNEVRFDMFDAELTHEGSRCTFEVIVERFGLDAAGLRAVAEIVHDIDLKEARYGRPETEGVAALVAGICRDAASDGDRLARGRIVFDGLLAAAAVGTEARRRTGKAKGGAT
jgi:hypothetical protein